MKDGSRRDGRGDGDASGGVSELRQYSTCTAGVPAAGGACSVGCKTSGCGVDGAVTSGGDGDGTGTGRGGTGFAPVPVPVLGKGVFVGLSGIILAASRSVSR